MWRSRCYAGGLCAATRGLSRRRKPGPARRPNCATTPSLSGTPELSADGIDPKIRQLVRAVVAGRVGVPFHPVPDDVVLCSETIEREPEVGIFDRLAHTGLPAVLLPGVDPCFDAVFDVLGVGVDRDAARARQRLERPDHSRQLHAVVGGVRFTAVELPLAILVLQKRTPATRPRIALARAIGVDGERRRRHAAL